MPVSTSNKKKVLQMLQRRHPDYIGKLPHWTFLRKTYEGGRNWFYDNIFRYLKEGDQEYMDRLKRAYRFNHTREIVDLVQKYIFKTEPARNVTDAPAAIKTFWEDCTLAGLEINQFMRLVSTASSIDGRIWVFVDSTQSQVGVSVADAKKALESNDAGKMTSALESLSKAGAEFYAEAQAAAQAAAKGPGEAAGPESSHKTEKKADVVDADFEVVDDEKGKK